MDKDKALRNHLLELLRGRQAHVDAEATLSDLPKDIRGRKTKALPYTPWELLEHMRIAQWDILEFSRRGDHVSPEFPQGYWPSRPAPPNEGAWEDSVSRFQADRREMMELVRDPATDLYAPIAHGTGQTILREALLVADHNAYHLGQLVLVRRILGGWR